MEYFQLLMLAGALLGLAMVCFGVVLIIKRFGGEIEINLKLGSLKTGSAGLATMAMGMAFFLFCAVSEQKVEERNQQIAAKDAELGLKDDAAQRLAQHLVAALQDAGLDSKDRLLRSLLGDPPPTAAGSAPATAGAVVAAAKPAPNPEYDKLKRTIVADLVQREHPEVIKRLKETDPLLAPHLGPAIRIAPGAAAGGH